MINQSNTTNTVMMAFIGTAALLSSSYENLGIKRLLPFQSYPYDYTRQQQSPSYLPQYEIDNNLVVETLKQQLIEIPVIKQIKVRFNRPVSLEFICVEDENGFIV